MDRGFGNSKKLRYIVSAFLKLPTSTAATPPKRWTSVIWQVMATCEMTVYRAMAARQPEFSIAYPTAACSEEG